MSYHWHHYTPETEFGKKVDRFIFSLIARLFGLWLLLIPFLIFGYAGGKIFGYRYRWGLIPTIAIWIYMFFYIKKKNKEYKELGIDADSFIKKSKISPGNDI